MFKNGPSGDKIRSACNPIYRTTALGNRIIENWKENMIQTGVAGHWSVKHVIAHIAAYESWLEKCKPVSSHPQNCSDQNPGT
jgi:hypothetical protein